MEWVVHIFLHSLLQVYGNADDFLHPSAELLPDSLRRLAEIP